MIGLSGEKRSIAALGLHPFKLKRETKKTIRDENPKKKKSERKLVFNSYSSEGCSRVIPLGQFNYILSFVISHFLLSFFFFLLCDVDTSEHESTVLLESTK